MKLEVGMFKVTFGYNYRDYQTDNCRSENVLALTATDAIKKARAEKSEYIAGVALLNRVG